ncbi:ORF6N domain-containing protein [bacterium]|nr:ORF6N domain-containing protein [bacterium]
MKTKSSTNTESLIHLVRDQRVILDSDLALLYGVQTKVLLQAIKRNKARFPQDFIFMLTFQEVISLRSQIVTSKSDPRGGRRTAPYAFTEQGVAMLSSVLKSKNAIQVNIEIMRTFVKLRNLALTHEDLAKKLNNLEQKYDQNFRVVFDAIRQIMAPEKCPEKRRIGFMHSNNQLTSQ